VKCLAHNGYLQPNAHGGFYITDAGRTAAAAPNLGHVFNLEELHMGLFTFGTKNKPLISISIDPGKRHIGLHMPDAADNKRWEKTEGRKDKSFGGFRSLLLGAAVTFAMVCVFVPFMGGSVLPSTLSVTRTVNLKLPSGMTADGATMSPCALEAGGSLSTLNMANIVGQNMLGGQPVRLSYTPAAPTPRSGECPVGYEFALNKGTLTQFTQAAPDHDDGAGLLGAFSVLAIPLTGGE
jgi:hypothetical protein